MKKYLLYFSIAFVGGLFALSVGKMAPGLGAAALHRNAPTLSAPVRAVNYNPDGQNGNMVDFTFAAEQTLPVVVHIQSTIQTQANYSNNPFNFGDIPEPFRQFFGTPRMGSPRPGENEEKVTGSGVVISPDGYIVTNNHVVRDASKLIVTLNDKHSYTATVVGADPSSDIALIKIDAKDLPFISFGNSDEVRVGSWVVAVGNPFNLASTVTAGIVSAKGRDLHIVEDKAPVESFIQTDAVVNPGNSGGALVNLNGKLIGINTAIASPTGVYAGYAFAIPSNLVAKVVDDLKTFGVVQRGYLGITIRNIDDVLAKEKELGTLKGVYVDSLADHSAARSAGIRRGDVITSIDQQPVTDSPALLEIIGKHRPGDQVNVDVLRKGDVHTYTVTLKNHEGNTDVVKKSNSSEILRALGADFETLSKENSRKLGIEGGVEVASLSAGKLSSQTNLRKGFIITKVNRQAVHSVEELTQKLEDIQGGVLLEGLYPDSNMVYYYAFGI